MISKKGDISTTILWVGAAFILFLILFLYFLYVLTIGGLKSENKNDLIKSGYDSSNDLALLNSFHSFLNSQIQYGSETISVKDLVVNDPLSDKSKYQEFKKLANEFMEENIMSNSETGSGKPTIGSVRSSWLRIYGFDETIREYSSVQTGLTVGYDKYYDFEIRRQKIATPCNPYLKESNMFYYILPNNKRIVLCVEYEK